MSKIKKVNKSRYAILGMLFDGPASGYAIMEGMHRSTGHFWQESDASVYPMLKMLEAEGKVTARSEFVGKREKKIFEITQLGKEEFLAWLAMPVGIETRRDELLLKVFFGAATKPEDTLKHLYARVQKAQEEKKQFQAIETFLLSEELVKNPNQKFWMMSLRNGLIHINAELQWLRECIKVLEAKIGIGSQI